MQIILIARPHMTSYLHFRVTLSCTIWITGEVITLSNQTCSDLPEKDSNYMKAWAFNRGLHDGTKATFKTNDRIAVNK